jgi:hypothetical protein
MIVLKRQHLKALLPLTLRELMETFLSEEIKHEGNLIFYVYDFVTTEKYGKYILVN